MLAKNQINRNKMDNSDMTQTKSIDFTLLIENDTDGHIEWE